MKSFLWVAFLPIMLFADEPQSSAPYSQSYSIFIRGENAGSEVVTEKIDADGNILATSEHELIINDGLEKKRTAYATRMVLKKSDYTPISYSYRYVSGNSRDSYEVIIKDGQISRTLIKGGQHHETKAPFTSDMVILDFNVYHQYDYLLRKYSSKKGGRQTFSNFLPVIGNDIPIALSFLGNAKVETQQEPIAIRNFRIEFVGIWSGTLSVDKEGRLIQLSIPAQDLEVRRSDLISIK
jgi:hypothetical protein